VKKMDLTNAALNLIHFGAVACLVSGGAGLAVAVFQIAFNAFVEATVIRAAMQFVMLPIGAYLFALKRREKKGGAANDPHNRLTIVELTTMITSLALIVAGCAGLAIGSLEMTLHYMPLALWQRMVFYTATVVAGIVIAPLESEMNFF